MRDNKWLEDNLAYVLNKYFANIELSNPLEIKFGREAKFRFGSIKLYRKGIKGITSIKSIKGLFKSDQDPQKSIITVTKMFASEEVPVEVVEYTIAHELCHYAHGFSSSNKRLFRHPHHGGVVNAEIKNRGGEHLISAYKKWIREYRKKILAGRARI